MSVVYRLPTKYTIQTPIQTLQDACSIAIWVLNFSCATEFGPLTHLWTEPTTKETVVRYHRCYDASRILLQNNDIRILCEPDSNINFSHVLLYIADIAKTHVLAFVRVACHIPGIVCITDPSASWIIVAMVTLRNFRSQHHPYGARIVYLSSATQQIYSDPALKTISVRGSYEPAMFPEFHVFRWYTVLRPTWLVIKRKCGIQDGAIWNLVVSFL